MITRQLFDRIFPTKGFNPAEHNLIRRRDELINALNKFLPRYKIDSYLRLCAFLACCGVETAYFRTTSEYASGKAYDTRTDLGNTPERDGDGEKYKGSGLIQTTGLYNFWRVVVRFVKKLTGKDFSKDEKKYRNFRSYTQSKEHASLLAEATRLGVNFIDKPHLLRQNIEIAVESACIFWEENDLNFYADRGLFKQLNGIVNRGDKDKTPLHWAERNLLYSLCKRRIPADFRLTKPPQPATTVPAIPEPVALTPTERDEAGKINAQNLTPTPGTDGDSFLAAALDKNVSGEEMKTAARTAAPRILARFARPFALLYAALEAGSVAAWLGVACGVIAVALLIYWHRHDLKKIWQTVKTKFTA